MLSPSTAAVALTAAMAGLATAAAIHTPKVGTFSVAQMANPNFKPDGPAQLAKTLAKYGAPLPSGLARTMAAAAARRRRRLDARGTGSAEAVPQANDYEYLTPVSIGTPARVLALDLDSGSSDLWVFSTLTPAAQVASQTLYGPANSTTAAAVDGASWRITYGDQSSCSGVVYRDVVDLGGVVVRGQAVEAATEVSYEFTADSATDGILGLGFGSINTVRPTQEKTWFDNAVAAGQLDAPVWTADLRYQEVGSYDFGFIDEGKYAGAITYVDVDPSRGFWMTTTSGYAIGNRTFTSAPFRIIADTGTSLALLPNDIVKAYYASVPNAVLNDDVGGYVFPCANARLPDFVLGLGPARVTIPGRYINYGADSRNQTCFGGIQSDEDVGMSILGDVLLKSAFVVFDATPGKPRLGWAKKRI
ncbi:secreted aspartic proteinase precursor [Xylaria palmicola]|nr:secreted aspartic proteinase precursor [Xylaria palmicola]